MFKQCVKNFFSDFLWIGCRKTLELFDDRFMLNACELTTATNSNNKIETKSENIVNLIEEEKMGDPISMKLPPASE